MKNITEINSDAYNRAFGGAKIPHSVSNPVIRREQGRYYLAYFANSYTRQDLTEKSFPRPAEWMLFDIDTGELAEHNICRDYDFSEESFESRYLLASGGAKGIDRDYFNVLYSLLDTVRASIIYGDNIDNASYSAYISKMLAIVPKEYHIFYRDLSDGIIG